jgi:hypothetical protein
VHHIGFIILKQQEPSFCWNKSPFLQWSQFNATSKWLNLELFSVSLLYYSLQFYAIHIYEMCAVTLNICVSKMCWIYFQMRSKLPPCFAFLKWLTLITLDKDCRLRSFSLWHCLHPTVTSSLINLKYLYILFCNNGDLCSSFNRNRNYNYASCILWFVSGHKTRRRRILHEW